MLKSLIDGIQKAITGAKTHEESIMFVMTGFSQFLDCYKSHSLHLTDEVFERLILDVIASYEVLQIASKENKEKLTALLEYIPSETDPEKTETEIEKEIDWESRKV